VPIPFTEVYTALETKAIEGQENPYASIHASKYDEAQKYLSATKPYPQVHPIPLASMDVT
jgi:TRAP-type C4-dicarboxylate transport system substrate-binding protein